MLNHISHVMIRNLVINYQKLLKIDDVMTYYDYLRVENELDHLKLAKTCGHG